MKLDRTDGSAFVLLLGGLTVLFATEILAGWSVGGLASFRLDAFLPGLGMLLGVAWAALQLQSRLVSSLVARCSPFLVLVALLFPLMLPLSSWIGVLSATGAALPIFLLVEWTAVSDHRQQVPAWALILVLTLAVSPDWFRVLPLSSANLFLMTGGSILTVALLARFLYLGLPRFSEAVRGIHGPAIVSFLVLGSFVTGLWWLGTKDHGRSATAYFTGEEPEVRLTGGQSVNDRPNVVLISLDTLRADMLPPHAPEDLEIPHLRHLYRDSLRFTNLYSTSSWTLPAHASLFTGLLPMEHGAVKSRGSRIYGSVPSYTQVFQELGYRTGGFTDGGFVSDELGFARGFDVYRERYTDAGEDHGFAPGWFHWGRRLLEVWSEDGPSSPEEKSSRHYFSKNLRAAHDWLRQTGDAKNPFFLFLHTYQIHDYYMYYPEGMQRLEKNHPKLARAVRRGGQSSPLLRRTLTKVEQDRLRRRLEEMEGSSLRRAFRRLDEHHGRIWSLLKLWIVSQSDEVWSEYMELSTEQQKKLLFRTSFGVQRWGFPRRLRLREYKDRKNFFDWLRTEYGLSDTTAVRLERFVRQKLAGWEKLYRYQIEAVDRSLGDFLTFLEDQNLADETMLVVLSDHGEGFRLDPLTVMHGHRNFFDGRGQLQDVLIRLPLWIRFPGGQNAGKRCRRSFPVTEVFPLLFRAMKVRVAGNTSLPAVDPSRSAELNSIICPSGSDGFVRGSVGERVDWVRDVPRFFVRGDTYKLVVQPAVNDRYFSRLNGTDDLETRVSDTAVPRTTRRRLDRRMKELLDRFDRLPDPYRRQRGPDDESLEKELRGLGYF